MKKTGQSKRLLHSHSLSAPDFWINPQVLIEDYIEKDVQYAGLLSPVPADLDVTNRTEVLKLIDDGRSKGVISSSSSTDREAILSLDINNVKLSNRLTEELILRLPIHEIAAVCYVKDGDQHILVIKSGIPSHCCQVVCLYVKNKICAEEICALVGQCFYYVYTEATMEYFDKELQVAANESSFYLPFSSQTDSSLSQFGFSNPPSFAFLTRSNPDLHFTQMNNSLSLAPTFDRTTSCASELSTPSAELLQGYIRKVQLVLKGEELSQFVDLLKAKRTHLPFSQFCQQLINLFGPERKHVLKGLWPFISERDYLEFESFLKRHSIDYMESDSVSVSSTLDFVSNTSDVTSVNSGNTVVESQQLDIIFDHVLSSGQNSLSF